MGIIGKKSLSTFLIVMILIIKEKKMDKGNPANIKEALSHLPQISSKKMDELLAKILEIILKSEIIL